MAWKDHILCRSRNYRVLGWVDGIQTYPLVYCTKWFLIFLLIYTLKRKIEGHNRFSPGMDRFSLKKKSFLWGPPGYMLIIWGRRMGSSILDLGMCTRARGREGGREGLRLQDMAWWVYRECRPTVTSYSKGRDMWGKQVTLRIYDAQIRTRIWGSVF